MSEKIYYLDKMNGVQIDNLERDRTIVIMSSAPYEVHGPHLPISTDIQFTDYFVGRLASRISGMKKDYQVLVVPVIPLGAQVFKSPGSVDTRQNVLRDVMVDFIYSLSRHGFKKFILMTAHGSPKHLVALEEAALFMSRKPSIRVLALSGRIIQPYLEGKLNTEIEEELGRKLTTEEVEALGYDLHAGLLETAIMKKLAPDQVDDIYKELPPVNREKLHILLRPNAMSSKTGQKAYLGSPAMADESIAEAFTVVFEKRAMKLVERFLEGKRVWRQSLSKFYYVPFFRSHFRTVLFFLIWTGVAIGLLLYFFKQLIPEGFK